MQRVRSTAAALTFRPARRQPLRGSNVGVKAAASQQGPPYMPPTPTTTTEQAAPTPAMQRRKTFSNERPAPALRESVEEQATPQPAGGWLSYVPAIFTLVLLLGYSLQVGPQTQWFGEKSLAIGPQMSMAPFKAGARLDARRGPAWTGSVRLTWDFIQTVTAQKVRMARGYTSCLHLPRMELLHHFAGLVNAAADAGLQGINLPRSDMEIPCIEGTAGSGKTAFLVELVSELRKMFKSQAAQKKWPKAAKFFANGGYIQEVMLDFNGDEDTSDALSKADMDLTASEMLAIRLCARGCLGTSVAELRKMAFLAKCELPPQIYDLRLVLRMLKLRPDDLCLFFLKVDEFQRLPEQAMGLGRSEAEAQDLMKKVLTAAGNLAVEEGGFSSAAMDIGVIVQPVFAGTALGSVRSSSLPSRLNSQMHTLPIFQPDDCRRILRNVLLPEDGKFPKRWTKSEASLDVLLESKEFTGLLYDCGGHPRVYISKLGKYMEDADFQKDVAAAFGAGSPTQMGLHDKSGLVEILERRVINAVSSAVANSDLDTWAGGEEGLLALVIAAVSGCEVSRDQKISAGFTMERAATSGYFTLRVGRNAKLAYVSMSPILLSVLSQAAAPLARETYPDITWAWSILPSKARLTARSLELAHAQQEVLRTIWWTDYDSRSEASLELLYPGAKCTDPSMLKWTVKMERMSLARDMKSLLKSVSQPAKKVVWTVEATGEIETSLPTDFHVQTAGDIVTRSVLDSTIVSLMDPPRGQVTCTFADVRTTRLQTSPNRQLFCVSSCKGRPTSKVSSAFLGAENKRALAALESEAAMTGLKVVVLIVHTGTEEGLDEALIKWKKEQDAAGASALNLLVLSGKALELHLPALASRPHLLLSKAE